MVNWSYMPFGKYAYKEISSIKDLQYLEWIKYKINNSVQRKQIDDRITMLKRKNKNEQKNK